MTLKQLLSVGVGVAILPGIQGDWAVSVPALKNDLELDEDFETFPDCATYPCTGPTVWWKQADRVDLTEFLRWASMENGPYTSVQQQAKEVKVSREAFKIFDTADTSPKDGKLDAHEWRTMLDNVRPTIYSSLLNWVVDTVPACTPTDFTNAFKSSIAQNSITRAEFLEYVQDVTGVTFDGLTAALKEFDIADEPGLDSNGLARGDRRLSRAEWRKLLAANGVGNAAGDFDTWVTGLNVGVNSWAGINANLPTTATYDIDQDGDNQVTRGEWGRWFVGEALADPVTAAQIAKMAKANADFDRAKGDDEVVTRTELLKFMEKTRRARLARAALPYDPTSPDWIKRIVRPSALTGGTGFDVDLNRDGKVSLSEFLTWGEDQGLSPDAIPQIIENFNRADADGDFQLFGGEFETMQALFLGDHAADNTDKKDDQSVAPTTPSKCFDTGVDYYGHDVRPAKLGVGSAGACQQSCATVTGAKFFQFTPVVHSMPSVCWCKSSKQGAIRKEHRTVGPVKCLPGGRPELGSGGPDRFVGAWESRAVDAPTNSVAIVGTVMGTGALAMALVLWLAGKRFNGRSQQLLPEAVPLEVQE